MVLALVHTPYYDWDGRKYMEFLIENRVTRVKIPFRYGRVMCLCKGLKTVQDFQKGDLMEIELEKKVWDGTEHWILASVREITDS